MPERWTRKHLERGQSILTLLGPVSAFTRADESLVRDRRILDEYIRNHPDFEKSLVPLPCDSDDPDLIQEMLEAGRALGVGPMASVAGVLAGRCLQAMIRAGAEEAVVDNGGDMAMIIRAPLRVGLFAGTGGPQDLALEMEPSPCVQALAASSGTVGHSFSRGKADIAVTFSSSPALADAAATALGNHVRNGEDLEYCFHHIDIPGIHGALVILGQHVALWGRIPRLCRCTLDPDLITRGRGPAARIPGTG